MKKKLNLILFLISLCPSYSSDYEGKDFMINYMYLYEIYNGGSQEFLQNSKLIIYSQYNTEIEIYIPSGNYKEKYKIVPNQEFIFSVPSKYFTINRFTKKTFEPIYIHSQEDIILNVEIINSSTLIPPITKLSNKYFVASHNNSFDKNEYNNKCYYRDKGNKEKTYLSIISTNNDNEIIIKSKNRDYDNTLFYNENKIKLQKGESVLYRFEEDISGTYIESNYDILVSTATIQNIQDPRDILLEVMKGYDFLGTEHIVLPFYGNPYVSTFCKIISTDDFNELTIDGQFIRSLKKGEVYYLCIEEPTHLITTKPVAVHKFSDDMLYEKEDLIDKVGFDSTGGPSHLQVMPVSQIEKNMIFHFPDKSDTYSSYYLSILKEKDDSCYINKIKYIDFRTIENTNFEYSIFKIDEDFVQITSSNGLLVDVSTFTKYHQLINKVIYSSPLSGASFQFSALKRNTNKFKLNNKYNNKIICYDDGFKLFADTYKNYNSYSWIINDTFKIEGKEVNLELFESGDYNVKLILDNLETIEHNVKRLDKIVSNLDSVIYLCNENIIDLNNIITGGGDYKKIKWFPADNIQIDSLFHIFFNEPIETTTKLYFEVLDEYDCYLLDSIEINVTNIDAKITQNKISYCYGDIATLHLVGYFDNFIWSNGSKSKSIELTESGSFSAIVNLNDCSKTITKELVFNELPSIEFNLPNGSILCDDGELYIEVVNPNKYQINWNDGSRVDRYKVKKAGFYYLTINNIESGCSSKDSIEIFDIENLIAEIQGDPTFCYGESTTLTIQPQGKSYLWSNGETTQSIVVNNSGNYSATITTDTDCKIDAEIEVEKLPLPTFQILGETIICNNSTTIYPDKDFKFYKWSNGETSKSITIDKVGNYDLTVTDNNGCKATQSIEITESTPEINLSNRNIDFGELLFGNTKSEKITTDRDIIFLKNSSIFDVNYQNKNINISFNPKDIGQFIDTLIIESTGDCKALDTIYIKGICKAEILAKVSNSEGYPGDLVNNTVNLELMQNIPLPKDFNYEIGIQINEDAISIIDATTFNYTNNKLEINIADYLNKTSYDEKVKEINSKILLAKNLQNELIITKFETDNPYLIPVRQNGNIKIYEICLYEARLIEHYNEAIIKQVTKTNTTLTTYYAGKYTIEITDISGKTITKEITTTSDNEEINFNYKLSNGTYIIKITEPGKTQTRKIIFGE